MFRESLEYVISIHSTFGTDFQSARPLTPTIYNIWKYAFKSLIILHNFINPIYYSHDKKEDDLSSSIPTLQQSFLHDNIPQLLEIEENPDNEGPRLSRLFTHEDTDPTKLPTSKLEFLIYLTRVNLYELERHIIPKQVCIE